MIKWLTIPDDTKRRAYVQIAEDKGMSAFAVEKDWWVVQSLSVIFNTEVAPDLVFKGGTSLSKGWNLIKRFSEDVDLAINREFFGFSGTQAKHQRDKLRKKAGKYIDEVFFPEIEALFRANGFTDLRFEPVPGQASDRDRVINIFYPNLIKKTVYMEAKVQIEITSRSLHEPNTNRSFASLVDESYPTQDFVQAPITIPCVNPERTFLEKIFLLHEEFQRPPENSRVDRMSRHLYDVVKLSKTEYAAKALAEPALYMAIVDHRYQHTRIGFVNYNLHQPLTINPIPNPELLKAWEKDYNKMTEMIYDEDAPPFEQLIEELTLLKERINALPWELIRDYPR
jgi:predicted nucleotidyltransferase component of viral defense system